MIQLVDEILAPHIELCPSGIIPLLALDSYRCHMMASVVHRIQILGVEIEHIPGGCTGLCQPLDVGLNKPLKSYIKREWNDWMLDEGVVDGTAVCPPRELIVEWTIDSWWRLKEEHIKKAWRHGEYSWFL